MDQIREDTELFVKAEKAIRDNEELRVELAELRPLAQLAKVIILLQGFNDRTKEEWHNLNAECRRLRKIVDEECHGTSGPVV
jgi:hypothetical protein